MNLPMAPKNLTELILQSVHVKLTLSLDGKIIRAYSRINPDTKNIEIPQLAGKSLSDCANLDLVKKIQSSIQNITVEQQPQEGFITLSSQGGRKIFYEVMSIGEDNFFVYLRQELNESIYHQFRLIKDLFISLSNLGTEKAGSDQLVFQLTKFDPAMIFGLFLFDQKGEETYHTFSNDQMEKHAQKIIKLIRKPENWQLFQNGLSLTGNMEEVADYFPKKEFNQFSTFGLYPVLNAGNLIGCYHILSLTDFSAGTHDFFEEFSRQSGIILASIREFQYLAKRNRLFESLMNTSQERAFIVTEQGFTFYISPKLAEKLGIPKEECYSTNILDFVELSQKEKLSNQLKQSTEKYSETYSFSFTSLQGKKEIIPLRFRKISAIDQTFIFGKVFDAQLETSPGISIPSQHMMELTANLPFPVLIVNEFSFEIKFANNFAHEFLLYSPDELFEKNFLDLFPTTENINLINTVKSTGLKKLESENKWLIEKKDHSTIKTRLIVNEILYRNEKSVVIFFRDITSNSAHHLREQSSDYQIDQPQTIQCQLSPDGIVIQANKAYGELLGKPVEKVVGKPLQENILLDDYEEVSQHLSKLSIEEPIRKNRNRIVNPHGQIRWVEWTDKAIFENGELVRIDAIGQDITEDYQQEVFRKSIEQRYQALVENLPMVIYVLHPNTAFPVYISPQLEEYLGFRPEEFYLDPDKWSDIVHPDDRDEFIRVIQQKIHSGDSTQFEFRVLHKDGSSRWFIESGSVIHLIDGTLLFQGVFLDVTARRKVREKLQYYSSFERLIIEISLKLMNADKQTLPDTMNFVIEELGRFMKVDRVYIFDLDYKSQTLSNTFEWCNQGILPVIDELQGIPFSRLPWWMDQLRQNLEITLDNIENMPPGSEAECELLKYQGIKSLLVVPITYEGKPQGFIGFDMVRDYTHWEPEAINLLRMVSAMITSTYKKNL